MKTLLLNLPSFQGFDGGAGSRWQARREVHSFWYPTWLCYPAGLIRESRVLDAPAAGLSVEDTMAIAKEFEPIAVYTSAPGFRQDVRLAERIKAANPGALIGFIGPHPTVFPEETLEASSAIDFVTRGEFDYMLRDIAAGADLSAIAGLSIQGLRSTTSCRSISTSRRGISSTRRATRRRAWPIPGSRARSCRLPSSGSTKPSISAPRSSCGSLGGRSSMARN